MNERVALFIDGSNLHATTRALRIDLDFKALLSQYTGLVRAYYYTAIIEDGGDSYVTIRPLVDWLAYNGYSVVSKMAKQFTDPSTGRVKVKGNMDCELTVDAMTLAFNRAIDHAVFFTGDGDFKSLLLAMQQYGVRCTVVSTIVTEPPMCADELRRVADKFVEFAEFGKAVARQKDGGPVIRSSKGKYV